MTKSTFEFASFYGLSRVWNWSLNSVCLFIMFYIVWTSLLVGWPFAMSVSQMTKNTCMFKVSQPQFRFSFPRMWHHLIWFVMLNLMCTYMSNTKACSCEEGSAYPSGALEISPGYSVRVAVLRLWFYMMCYMHWCCLLIVFSMKFISNLWILYKLWHLTFYYIKM